MRFLSLGTFFSLVLLIFAESGSAQPDIGYIIPNIGAPGMNTYVEIIAQHDANGTFGADLFRLNNPGDAVQVEPIGFLADKVIVGPLVVSWNGRLISTQVFVKPGVLTGTGQLRVRTPSGSGTVDFEIVTPQSSISSPDPGALGSGGAFGTRSKRGAMIVESLSLLSGNYTFSTNDLDGNLSNGRQGYLPFIIIAKNAVSLGPITLDASANGRDGGPGGGGGGGQVCDANLSGGGSDGTVGGNGFTAGGGGGRNNSGVFTGFPVFGDSTCVHKNRGLGSGSSGGSLNTASSGLGSQECDHPEGAGGGTGHPFGRGGDNGCIGSAGKFGGGATGGQDGGGGGGGYRLDGSNGSGGSDTRGREHGNSQLVPFAGGSGGASGNPRALNGGCSGFGGGGGGAIAIYSMGFLNSQARIQANGADGQNVGSNSDGGSGSGGAILLGAKIGSASRATGLHEVGGGSAAGRGGAGSLGRGRYDGFLINQPSFTKGASVYIGPTTDTHTYSATSTFTISGTLDITREIRVYMRSEDGAWSLQPAPIYNGRTWSLDLTANDGPGNYYIAAFQQVPSPNNGEYTAEPSWVTSQVAANIVKVDAVPRIDTIPIPNGGEFGNRGKCPNIFHKEVIKFKSVGEDTLTVRTVIINQNTPGPFRVSSPVGLTSPGGLKYGKDSSREISIEVEADASAGDHTALLLIITNDPRLDFDTIGIPLHIQIDSAEIELLTDTIDFGQVCIQQAKIDSALIRFRGNVAQFNITDIQPDSRPPFFKDYPRDGDEPQFFDDSLVAIVIRFRPRNAGQFFDSLTVVDECERKYVVYLRGEGIEIMLEAPDSISFPRTVVGTTRQETRTIKNNGSSTITFSTPEFSSLGSRYRIVDPPTLEGIMLDPGDSIEITIEFAPDRIGSFNGVQLKINIEGTCNDVPQIILSGEGVEICLKPIPEELELIADSCSIDPNPIDSTITIENCGGISIDLDTSFAVNGKVMAEIATPQTLTTQNEGGHTTQLTVTWDPTSSTGTDSIAVVWRESGGSETDTLWIPITLKFDRATVQLRTARGDTVPRVLDIGGAYQCRPTQDTVVLVNAGTVEGKITGFFTEGGVFSVSPPPPYRLAVGEKKQLIITLDPANTPEIGRTYEDTLVLENGRCDQQWKIALRSTRYKLEIDIQDVNFPVTNLNLPRQHSVQLTNITNAPPSEELVIEDVYIDPPTASPPFAFTTPPTLPARVPADGGVYTVDLSFTPDQEEVYEGRLCFKISEPCDMDTCVNLRGEGIRSNIYVTPSELDFGEVYYCQEEILSLTIYSVGPVALTVDGIRIEGPDRGGFEIISTSKSTPATLEPATPQIIDSIDVLVRFIPNNLPLDGPKRATLEISSNDSAQGLIEIPLTGNRTSPQIVGPATLVDYGTVVVSATRRLPITLTNTSNDTIKIFNPSLKPPFSLATPIPLMIPPNSTIEVYVKFTPDSTTIYHDTLVGSFSLPCEGEMRVPLRGEGLQSKTIIAIPTTITGEPKEEILIPIVLKDAQAVADVGATTLHVKVRFNGSMLLPIDVQLTNGIAKGAAASGLILSNNLQGVDRVVELELKNDPLPAAPDTLCWLNAVVLLGDDITTPIHLEDPIWIVDGDVTTSTQDGKFTLHGYCTVGGDRLVRVEGLFGVKAVAPNPLAEETEIEFETVENGKTTLEVYDVYSRRVATLLDVDDLPVQAHIATWNADRHPPGLYYVVLTTRTQRSVQRMVVIK